MADEQGSELLMMMKLSAGKPLAAESQTRLIKEGKGITPDPLVDGFENGYFFSITEFAFGMNIDDQDAASDAANTGGGQGVVATPPKPPAPKGKFGRWKTASPQEIAKMSGFPVRMDEFSVSRGFDRSSPVLFQSCALSATFTSVSVVKRKIIGGAQLRTFFRLDFDGVLVTHVGWDDGDVIKETMRFVFRKIDVRYRRQAHDGGLLAAPGSVEWEYNAALRQPAGSAS